MTVPIEPGSDTMQQPAEPGPPNIEASKLALELRKQTFEEKKFEAELPSRVEQLAKLRAERESTELQAAELRAPFYKKPAFITAFFQGIAVLIALTSALISLGAWNSIRDAALAKQEASNAKFQQDTAEDAERRAREAQQLAQKEADLANQARGEAEQKRAQAEGSVETATIELRDADKLRDEKKKEAELASVKVILQLLEESHYYPTRFSKQSSTDSEIAVLVKSVSTADQALNSERIAFLRGYAASDARPLGTRLGVLRVLQAQNPSEESDLHSETWAFRSDFIRLATSDQGEGPDWAALLSLYDFLGSWDGGLLLCDIYRTGGSSPDYRVSLSGFIFKTAGVLVSSSKNCANAEWDWLSPESDAWRYRHPARIKSGGASPYIELAVRSSSNAPFRYEMDENSIVPAIVSLSRYLMQGSPQKEDGESTVTFDIGSEPDKTSFSFFPSESTWRFAEEQGEEPPKIEYGKEGAALDTIAHWIAGNADMVALFGESRLSRLRKCSTSVLYHIADTGFIARSRLTKLCPAGTLSP